MCIRDSNGLVAPATVVGVALGFGAQRIVQDILAGFFTIAERQYGFGDVIRISAVGVATAATGTVEDVTLRITRLRSVDGEVIIVPNGQVAQVTNLSRDWARAVIDVPIPATVDVGRATEILHQVGIDAYADPELRPLLLDPPTVMGVESIEVDEFRIRVVARCLPGKQFDVGRDLRAGVRAEPDAEPLGSSGANAQRHLDLAVAGRSCRRAQCRWRAAAPPLLRRAGSCQRTRRLWACLGTYSMSCSSAPSSSRLWPATAGVCCSACSLSSVLPAAPCWACGWPQPCLLYTS